MSLVAAGKSDARLQAYELITVVHSLSASLAQTADHNPNLVSLDVVEEKVLSLQNSGHECSAICRWLLQPDTIEVGGEVSRLRKCCLPPDPDKPRNLQVRLEELDKTLHSFGDLAGNVFGGRGAGNNNIWRTRLSMPCLCFFAVYRPAKTARVIGAAAWRRARLGDTRCGPATVTAGTARTACPASSRGTRSRTWAAPSVPCRPAAASEKLSDAWA